MWKLEIYPSLLEGAPIERHNCEGSLGAWLDACEIKWREEEEQPIIVSLDSLAYPVSEWDKELPAGSILKIRVIPRKSVFKFIGKIFSAIMKLFGVKTPKAMSNNSQNQKSLEAADVSANTAKLGEVVPEIAGTYRKYPDYLVQPHRYFLADDPRTQMVEFHACIGPGFYTLSAENVKIGNTPFADIGVDRGSYMVYTPGADLTYESTNENWYASPEVGATSSGTAGIELTTDIVNVNNVQPTGLYTIADGKKITRPDGDWPVAWAVGTVIDVSPVYSYTGKERYISNNRYTQTTGMLQHLMPYWGGGVPGYLGKGIVPRVISGFSSISGGVYSIAIDGSGNGDLITFGSSQNGNPQSAVIGISLSYAAFRITNITGKTLTLERVLRNYNSPPDWPISWSADSSWLGFHGTTLNAGSTVSFVTSNSYGLYSASFSSAPSGELTKKLELDFFFPSGLCVVDGDGNPQPKQVDIDVYIQGEDGSEYLETRLSFVNATVDQIGYTKVFEFETPIRPSVRVRRATPTSTGSQVSDKVVWYGMKSLLTNRTSYPNWTTMGVKMRSGGKLGQGSENAVNVLVTRQLPVVMSGGALTPTEIQHHLFPKFVDGQVVYVDYPTYSGGTPSREISSFFVYIAQTAGYDLTQLDMAELNRLEDIWRARGDTFNYVFDETTVKDALDLVLNAGFAETTVEDGILKPVRNVARTQFEQAYSPQNMVGQLVRKFQAPAPDDADGVEVDYMDERTWTRKTLVCALPGSDKARLEKIKVEGVTDRARAWRLGMRRMYELMYRRWSYSFSTELDGMCSNYLSYVPLFDDLPEYQQSALAVGIVSGIFPGVGLGYKVTLTEPIKWSEFAGGTITVAFRSRTGKISPYFTCRPITGPTVSEYQFGIGNIDFFPFKAWFQTLSGLTNAERSSGNLDINLGEPIHVYIGRTDRFCFPALITAVKPGDNNEVNIDAVNYDARIYQADDSLPPSDI